MNPSNKLNKCVQDTPIHCLGECFHMDFGFMSTKLEKQFMLSHDGYNYYLLIVDYYPCKNRSDIMGNTESFIGTRII